MMSAGKYNALPEARQGDRQTTRSRPAAMVNDQKFRDMEGTLVAAFRQRGMTIVESDRPAFQEAMAPV